jgi:hypothetical protein
MKRYVWMGGAGLAIAALLGVRAYEPAPVVASDSAAMPVLARNIQNADRIQIVHQGSILNLERRGQIWGLAQHGSYPVRPDMARRLLDQLLDLRLTHPNVPVHTELRHDDPADANATLTGVRVLATSGAVLGSIIVADHAAGSTTFEAHQVGDPRDWEASGPLDAPADLLAWVEPRILAVGAGEVIGAKVSPGAGSFTLNGAQAQSRLAALQSLVFTDVHPAAQVPAIETGRLVFNLAQGGSVTVIVKAQADQVWLGLTASGSGLPALHVPAGDWLFRYPVAAASMLQPAS